MTCRELVELVTDYCDGALDATTRDAFDAHLAVCPGCETYLEQIRTTVRLAHDLKTLEERPEVIGLLDGFRDWRDARPLTG